MDIKTESQKHWLPALWMVGTIISFCVMAVGGRELSGLVPVTQLLFIRSLIGLAVVSCLMLALKQTSGFRSKRGGLQVFRNVFHYAGQYAWFLGFGLLPLAEVFALEFTVPVWTAIIASLFLSESISRQKVLAIVVGLVGVLVIVQPGTAVFQPAALIVLASAFCYAVAHSSTKVLAKDDSSLTVLFYMCLVQTPIGFVFSLLDWQWPDAEHWLWIVIIGISALTAHFCMTQAMKTAPVTQVVMLDFLRLPAIALIGVWLYHEPLEAPLLIGGFLMLVSNLISVYRRKR